MARKKPARRVKKHRQPQTLSHDIRVYQEELIIQNEELRATQTTLEEVRDTFVELYEFAPNGYLTLDKSGVILKINLTGAALFARPRHTIEGMPLVGFAAPNCERQILDFLRRCRVEENGRDVVEDVTLRTGRAVQLLCKARSPHKGFLTAMIDVTDRLALQAERDASIRERAALASRLISIQDEERHRIARDLHDNAGQQVTALRLLLDFAADTGNDQSVRHCIAQAQSIVARLDAQLDFLTSELRPVALDLGAVLAVRQFVEEWSGTFRISAQFRYDGMETLRLKPDVETHVYRVVQEALNNVAKHADARHVTIELARYDTRLKLTICDDGRGFDVVRRSNSRASTHNHGHGFGLVGMRERAQIIKGTIEIQGTPGRGTTITLIFPDE